jgi:hypothetical protein
MEDSGRRVRVSTAITAARAALAAPVLDEPEDPGTQPLAFVPAPRLSSEPPWDGALPSWVDEQSSSPGEQTQQVGEQAPGDGATPGDDAPGFRRRARTRSRRNSVAPPGRVGQPGPGSAAPAGVRRQSLVRGATRSLFVTPWFAAATGFVIAAGLWVYSPHTVLRFPSSEPGLSVCKSKGCGQQSEQGGGKVTTFTPGVQILGPKAKKNGRPGHAEVNRSKAAAGLTFKFTVLWQRNHGFGATVTVSGHKVPGWWRLSFELPGTQIAYVTGVTWSSNSAGNGGTASQASYQAEDPNGNYSDGSNAFGAGTGDGGDEVGVDGAQSDAGSLPVISFLITGNGPAGVPSNCQFDGATCTFR